MNITPSNASLFVDDQEVPGNQVIQLEPGSREIRVEREGYRTLSERININPANTTFNFRLSEIDIVPVRISSNVPGATVSIDGTVRGQIDRAGGLGLFLFPGSYALNLSITGYVPQNRTLEVRESGANEIRVDLARNIGDLALRVTPPDARVSLNRQDYSGQVMIELAPGRYRLDVEKEGFDPHTETIDITLNQRTTRTINLEAYLGSLQFTVTPSNAQVELVNSGGQVINRWTGIQLLRNLPVGAYTLKVAAEGHTSLNERITITRDQTLQINFVLEATENSVALTVSGVECVNPISDIDGNTYRIVQIGSQCWMAENLKTTKYRDGTAIPNVTDNTRWSILTTGARSVYSNNMRRYNAIYGQLYNWYAVNDSRGLCPTGWHVPSDAEWTQLTNFLGENAGGKMKASGSQYWQSFNARVTNESEFTGLPAGNRSSIGTFHSFGSLGFWWSSTMSDTNLVLNRYLSDSYGGLIRSQYATRYGFSVRCVQD
jgi:uncharacterized protein (TIGR02145 family)